MIGNRDNCEKIMQTNDRLTLGNYNGIKVENLTGWLLRRYKNICV